MALTDFDTAPNFVNPQYATPEQLKALRDYSSQLMTGKGQQQVQRPWQGVSNIVNALVGGYEGHQADVMQQKGIQAGIDQTTPLIQQLIGGGQPNQSPSPQADASQPRGIRNNNPGNIEDGQFAQQQPGYTGSDGRFAQFATPEHGQAAMSNLLANYGSQGLNTANSIVSKWAPASDNNNPSSYAATVAKQLGISPDSQLNMNDPAVRTQLASAMSGVENGKPVQMASLNPTGGQSPPQGVQAAGGAPSPAPASPQVAQNGGMDPRQIAAMLQNPYVPKETKDMIMGLVGPKMGTTPYGQPYIYRLGDPSGAHMIPGVPGGVMKEGKFGNGVELPMVVTPPNGPNGQPGMVIPGSQQQQNQQPGQSPQSPFGGAQPFINQSIKNQAAAKGAESESGKQGEAMVDMQNTGLEAKQQIGNLQTIQELGKQSGYGLGPAMQDWMAQHGIYTPGVSEVQAYKNMIPYMGVLLRPEGSGRLMQQELQNFNSAVGGLMTTPAGRETAFQALSRIAQYRAQIGQIASNTDKSASERMSDIYNLEPPKFDWKAINAAQQQQSPVGQGSQTLKIDPAALAEAKRRGLVP